MRIASSVLTYASVVVSVVAIASFHACGGAGAIDLQPSDMTEGELNTPKGIYISKIAEGTWRLAFYAGPTNAPITYEGDLVSAANPIDFQSIRFESSDRLRLTAPGRLHFRNTVSSYDDVFSVAYEVGQEVCFELANVSQPVFFGPQKTRLTPPFSLATGGPCGVPAPADGGVSTPDAGTPLTRYKFNPGHYLAADTRSTWSTVLSTELPACPTIRGLRVRYNWEDLEPVKGQYDFSRIENDLRDLAKVPGGARKLQAMIQIRSFGVGTHVAPLYMRNDGIYGPVAQGGGEWEYASMIGGPGGKNLRLWNANVVARLKALMNALGTRFNAEPHFEMIGLPETAPGDPVNTPDYTIDGYFDGMLAGIIEMSKSFPNTITRAMVTFPRNQLTRLHNGKTLLETLVEHRVAIGWPDTVEHDSTLWGVFPDTGKPMSSRGLYYWAKQPVIAGNIVIAPEVQNTNFHWTNETRDEAVFTQNALGGKAPTIQEIFDFVKTFDAHYIVWSRIPTVSAITGNRYYEDVYEFLNRPAQRSNAAGGLNMTRPARLN